MTQRVGQIVAMGGGGFSMEPENELLDDFVLSLAPRQPARICFIPTASGDAPGYVVRFYRAFSARAEPSDLTLIDSAALARNPPRTSDLADFIAKQDIIYVGGGNTLNLLALWRAHGLDRLLREAWNGGAVLAGVSAGMLCWFQSCVTDSFGSVEALHDGLGILEGSACPHYDGEAGRRPTYHRLLGQGLMAGYAADDGAALHFVGKELRGAVSSRPKAKAYRVELRGNEVVETAISTRFLGAR
jgi:dipeptidase E